jgi:FKBP-type peptidyl-prolyl cis-trans isomerase FkpA
MKRYLLLFLSLTLIGCQPNQDKKPELKDQKDRVSYVIGQDIGKNFKTQMVDINPDVMVYAIKSATKGEESLMSEEEIRNTMQAFQKDQMGKQKEIMAKQTEEMEALAKKNAAEGEKFLTENKAKPGVKTTASGLQYKVITEGKGPKPKAGDTIVAHYKGTFINGTEFDSSYSRNEPASFTVIKGQIIDGWTEALQLMPVGSKWQLFIPAHLAYGSEARRGMEPNSTLIFEVELLEIKKAPKAGASAK